MKEKKHVPRGVKILSVLSFFYSGLVFVLGLIFLFVGIYMLQNPSEIEAALTPEEIAAVGSLTLIAPFFILFGVLFFLGAVLNLVVGLGLWKGKNWARIILIVLSALSLLFSFSNLISMLLEPETYTFFVLISSLFSVGVNIVIIWYLNQQKVKQFFLKK